MLTLSNEIPSSCAEQELLFAGAIVYYGERIVVMDIPKVNNPKQCDK